MTTHHKRRTKPKKACRRHAIPLTPHVVWGDTHQPIYPTCRVGPKTHHHELHHIILPHRHPHLPQRTHHQRGTRTGTIRIPIRHSKESTMPNLPHRRYSRPYTYVCILAVIPVAGLIRAASEDRQQQVAESKSTLPTLLWLGTRVCWI